MTLNPPNPAAYYALVWHIVQQIPAGQLSTYGQIASMIPAPAGIDPADYVRLAPRWVGNALNITPPAQDIPWQRVIGAKGTISLPAGSRRAALQRDLLAGEGVLFDTQGRVDFAVCGWEGPDAAWLAENGLLPPKTLRPPAAPSQPMLF